MAASKRKTGGAKRGRPSVYTEKLGVTICTRIAGGESLRSITRDQAMPGLSTVCAWIVDDEHTAFQEQYARARQAQAELLADDITDISDDGRNDWMEREDPENPGYTLNGEHIQRSRLRVDARKWIAARLLHRYADKQRHEHTGANGGPIQTASIDTSGLSNAALEELMAARDQAGDE